MVCSYQNVKFSSNEGLPRENLEKWLLEADLNADFTDDEIIEEFTAAQNDPEDAGRTNDEVEVSSTQFTVSSDEATLAATTLLSWSQERGVDMETVLQLKKVQEKVIAESYKRKKQKSILDYIC